MLAISTDYKNSDDDPQPYLRQIASAGFSHVHWCHQWNTEYLYSKTEIGQIVLLLRSYGLQVNDLHASSGNEYHYYSDHEEGRLASVALVKNRVHMASRLGTNVIVLHIPEQPEEGAKSIAFWDAVHRSMDILLPYARERNVRIAFENLFPTNHTTLNLLLASYDPSDVGICYDPGHGSIVGGGLGFVEAVKDRLIALHLNDNDTTADQHNLLFSAAVDWNRLAQIIAASGYEKEYMTMELTMNSTGIDDEAQFLAEAMASGERFHHMVQDLKRAAGSTTKPR